MGKHLQQLLSTLVLVFAMTFQGLSQDIHFSQFGNSPLNLNPGLTGIFKGDNRFMGHYRSQWNTVPVNYLTFSGAYDMNFYNEKLERSRFGAGLILNYDEAGDSKYTKVGVALNGSYTLQVTQRNFLTAGVQAGMGQRGFSTDDLQFDSQFNGEAYDPSMGNEENFINTNKIFPDLSAGLNWHFRSSNRTMLDIGGAIFHVNEPNKSFFEDDDVKLGQRYSLYGMGTFMLAKKLDLFLQGTGQLQDTHEQIEVGGGINLHLNTIPDNELVLALGAFYRFRDEGDAIIPYLGLRYRMWNFGLSYDVNISEFEVATDGFGGPEMSVSYVITKVKTVKKKVCPIFL